jgi:hypothetical protein
MIRIECESAPILAMNFKRNFNNISRVSELVKLYQSSSNQDLLRLSIVYLHASLEDCIRNVMYFKLSSSIDASLLNGVTFYDDVSGVRVDKIRLGDLLRFKGRTVEELIDLSIVDFVNRQTFNGAGDLVKVYQKHGVSVEPIKDILPDLEELITRRHEIVHNSDLYTDRKNLNSEAVIFNDGTNNANDIDSKYVEKSINATTRFLIYTIKSFLPEGGKLSLQNVD